MTVRRWPALCAKVSTALLLLGGAAVAWAHFPTLQCQAKNDSAQLQCRAGFSDGSVTGEVELQVFDYDEAPLFVVKTDSEGAATFAMPAGEFYIVFDADHETPAEFDYAELE
ncbi:MAG: hypothetical protein AAF515_13255 [Pseudomonadota bacterium]